eukprot:3967686-Pleurochrysis_carterae.AAC.1
MDKFKTAHTAASNATKIGLPPSVIQQRRLLTKTPKPPPLPTPKPTRQPTGNCGGKGRNNPGANSAMSAARPIPPSEPALRTPQPTRPVPRGQQPPPGT